jgi:hypothetical protein
MPSLGMQLIADLKNCVEETRRQSVRQHRSNVHKSTFIESEMQRFIRSVSILGLMVPWWKHSSGLYSCVRSPLKLYRIIFSECFIYQTFKKEGAFVLSRRG